MRKIFAVIAALALLPFVTADAETSFVDLELVLAVDASGSVDEEEFRLQLSGIAAAFRDPAIQEAILSGSEQRIAVALVVWSDSAFPKVPTTWHVLDNAATANRFADIVETFHSKTGRSKGIGGGGTSIGDAIDYSISMIEGNGIEGTRRVIDVSGDGIETEPWAAPATMLPEARVMAAKAGITVNGLAILNDYRRLNQYYRDNMIVGEGSFVLDAADYEDFKRAIREKLLREIAVYIG
jgi:hypothetical protein